MLSATLRQSTKEVSKIRQTREKRAVSRYGKQVNSLKVMPLPKTMRLKQAFANLNMREVGGVNDKLIIAIIMR